MKINYKRLLKILSVWTIIGIAIKLIDKTFPITTIILVCVLGIAITFAYITNTEQASEDAKREERIKQAQDIIAKQIISKNDKEK